MLAQNNQNPWAAVISHRIGEIEETEDTVIADLALSLNCVKLKVAVCHVLKEFANKMV